MGFYDQSVINAKGEEISMKEYEGKVVLVVNTATGCGFTPHYKDIEEMYEKYHEKGFEVIDVPCNQFAGQTPGTDEEIHEFCTLKYNTKLPQMKNRIVLRYEPEHVGGVFLHRQEIGDVAHGCGDIVS